MRKKTILVAPLHWGLGHATRCIPIINALLECKFNVLLASDGAALLLLKKEFPDLPFVELPSYNITYTKKASNFKWKLLFKLPHLKRTISAEEKMISKLVAEEKIDGIISDNRMGVYNKKIPCVYITHQLKVLSGKTTKITSKLHQNYVAKFDECWVPDIEGQINLSGKLGHLKKTKLPVKYIGVLSRMKSYPAEKKYDILAILSGPEPQRTMLEDILKIELKAVKGNVLIVSGVVQPTYTEDVFGNITICNFLQTKELEVAINASDIIISRSGYTTIMDLTALNKKAFFIPTPGQYEQEYLAKCLKKMGIVPSCKQENFNLEKLEKVKVFKGLHNLESGTKLSDLFSLFERKRKL